MSYHYLSQSRCIVISVAFQSKYKHFHSYNAVIISCINWWSFCSDLNVLSAAYAHTDIQTLAFSDVNLYIFSSFQIWCTDLWPLEARYNDVTHRYDVTQPSRTAYYTFITALLFFFPILVMSIAYSFVILRLWAKRYPGERIESGHLAQNKIKRKVNKLFWLTLSHVLPLKHVWCQSLAVNKFVSGTSCSHNNQCPHLVSSVTYRSSGFNWK